MLAVTVSSKFQIVIPQRVREQLAVHEEIVHCTIEIQRCCT